MISNEEFKRLIMSYTYQERKKKELKHYREEITHLHNIEKDELDLEYINAKTEYEHRKGVLSILLLSIALSILLDIWKYFFIIIENVFTHYAAHQMEIEILQVSIIIFSILVISISSIILGIVILNIRRIKEIYRKLLIIEVLKGD